MPMVWATRNGDGTAAHISEVARGLGCVIACVPVFRLSLMLLIAKIRTGRSTPHFRHHNAPESVACEVAAVT